MSGCYCSWGFVPLGSAEPEFLSFLDDEKRRVTDETYDNVARPQHSNVFDFDIVHEGSKGWI